MTDEERSKVFIPENWADLPWVGPADETTIRSIAAMISEEPIRNREAALAAVQKEVDRRAAASASSAAAPLAQLPVNIVTTQAPPREPVEAVPEVGAVTRKGVAPAAPAPDGFCTVRITKVGHGKVHTGKNDPATYDWNDEVTLPREVGLALEAKTFAEVLN